MWGVKPKLRAFWPPCNHKVTTKRRVGGVSQVGRGAPRGWPGCSGAFSPEWSGNLYIDYSAGFTENTVLGVRVDALYVDDVLRSNLG